MTVPHLMAAVQRFGLRENDVTGCGLGDGAGAGLAAIGGGVQQLLPEGRLAGHEAARRMECEFEGLAVPFDLRLAPALETLQALIDAGEGDSFDMAFIDADKASYDAYYESCLVLLRSNGLIMIDNTLWSGQVTDPGATDPDTTALRELNAKIHRDERVDQILLPVSDGLTLVRLR